MQINLHNLSKSLHEAFCKELNDAWLLAAKHSTSSNFNIDKFDQIKNLIQDAQKTGYQFQLHYESVFFLHKCLPETGEVDHPDSWKGIELISGFIRQCSEKGWENVKTKLLQLKDRKTLLVSDQAAIELSKKRGPFYTGQDLSTIYVYGLTGDCGQEMTLISLLYAHLEKIT